MKVAHLGGTDPLGMPGPSGELLSTPHSCCYRCPPALISLWLPALGAFAPASGAPGPPEGLWHWHHRRLGSRSWNPGSWSTWGCPWLSGSPLQVCTPFPTSLGKWSWGSSWVAWYRKRNQREGNVSCGLILSFIRFIWHNQKWHISDFFQRLNPGLLLLCFWFVYLQT